MPRFQILRNRKRIVLVTERLSEAGLPVAPHLNAITDGDWKFWENLLREHPNVAVVTLEFQTGYASLSEGLAALQRVADIQQKLGRLIHPILVGGAKHYIEAQRLFTRFTVMDSRPFMEAQARRVLAKLPSGGYRWHQAHTEEGVPIDDILATNLDLYPQKLRLPVPAKERLWFDSSQLELFDSSPYLTAQPAA